MPQEQQHQSCVHFYCCCSSPRGRSGCYALCRIAISIFLLYEVLEYLHSIFPIFHDEMEMDKEFSLTEFYSTHVANVHDKSHTVMYLFILSLDFLVFCCLFVGVVKKHLDLLWISRLYNLNILVVKAVLLGVLLYKVQNEPVLFFDFLHTCWGTWAINSFLKELTTSSAMPPNTNEVSFDHIYNVINDSPPNILNSVATTDYLPGISSSSTSVDPDDTGCPPSYEDCMCPSTLGHTSTFI